MLRMCIEKVFFIVLVVTGQDLLKWLHTFPVNMLDKYGSQGKCVRQELCGWNICLATLGSQV